MPTYIDTTNLSPATISTLQGPIITQIQITTSAYVVKDDTAVSTTGGYIKITGANFTAGTQVVIGTQAASSVTYVNSTTLNVQVPAQAAGTYVVYVTTNTGSVAILVNGLTYSGDPVWVTGSTLTGGQVDTAISIQLSATGDAPVTYVLQAGSSLPPGVTLSSGGLLSGTVTGITSETVYNFTIEAIDGQAQESPRTFSITITANDQYFEYVTSLLSAATPTSTFVTDASTNNFAVTVNGDTRPSNFGPYTPGYYSNYFDGSGDNISLAGNAAFTMPGDFTAEAWVFMTAYTGSDYSAIFGFSKDDENTGWNILVTPNGNPHINVQMTYTNCTGTIPLNKWTHVAMVRSGSASGNVKLYINGVADATTLTVTATATSPSIVMLGGYPGLAARAFSGYISNARVVKGAAVYTSNFTPSTTPLTAIANTSLLTCQSNRFIDNSTNNFTITRNGDTAISGFDPFVPSSSYTGYGSGYFDGTGDYVLTQSTTAMNLGANPFCLEMWVYLNATGSTYYGICGSQTDYKGPSISRYNSNLMYGLSSNGSSWNVLSAEGSVGSITINPYTWYHVVLCRTGNTISAYVNGARDLTITSSATLVSRTEGFCIGNWFAGLYPWNGYISNARFVVGSNPYDATQTTITVPTTPLTAIANTQLLTLQNNQPNNNSMFLDSSTNNFNITRNGNTTQGTFSPYGGGWSNYFGTAQFKLFTTGMTALGSDFTLELWIYPTSFNDYNTIFDNRTSDGDASGLVLGLTSAAKVYFYTNAAFQITTATSISLNTWTHIALVRSGAGSGNVKIYINGVADANTATYTTSFTRTAPSIGDDWGTRSNLQYYGYLSNLRATTSALYTSTFTPSTSPLTAISGTVLLTCQSNRFIDNSFSALTMTVTGTPTIQRFNPFNPVITTPTSYSGYFDGTGDYLSVVGGTALGSGNFTIEMWVYFSSYPNAQNALYANSTGGNATATAGVLYINSTGTLAFFNNPVTVAQSTGTVPLNQWVHVAAVRNSGTIRLYINGVQDGSGSNSTNISDTTMLVMQGFGGISASPIGYVSNLRVVVGTAVYTSNFTPSTTPLTAVANTALLTCQNATFIDNSANNYTITAFGDAAPRQFNPFGWTNTTSSNAAYTTTLYGGSAYFDGTGDSLSLAGSSMFTLGAQPGDFTIECWVYLTTTPGNYAAFMTTWTDASTNYTNRWFLGIASSKITWYNDAGTFAIQDSVNVPLNQWIHVAAVRNGSTITLYKNGVALGTQTTGQAYTTNGGLTMGYAGANSNYITGYISDARIFRGTALYKSNFQPPVAPLTALQNTVLLNNMTGAGIYDSSMMANYETVGNSSISTSIKKYGNTSMSFDGSGDYLIAPSSPNFSFGTGNFTIEGWIYPSATTGTDRCVYDTRAAPGDAGIVWFINSAANLSIYTSAAIRLTSSGTVAANTWQHIALVRSSGTVAFYINGTQSGTTSYSSAITCPGRLTVAGRYDNDALYTGYIDDFRITNGVARYTSTFTPPTTPLIRF